MVGTKTHMRNGQPVEIRQLLIACGVAFAIVIVAFLMRTYLEAPPESVTYLLTPCEDDVDRNCYWDGATRGTVVSYIDLEGVTYYPDESTGK